MCRPGKLEDESEARSYGRKAALHMDAYRRGRVVSYILVIKKSVLARRGSGVYGRIMAWCKEACGIRKGNPERFVCVVCFEESIWKGKENSKKKKKNNNK